MKSSVQISYLNHFLVEQTTFPYAETLFTRFLRISVSVDLWKVYIVYVRLARYSAFIWGKRITNTQQLQDALTQHLWLEMSSSKLMSLLYNMLVKTRIAVISGPNTSNSLKAEKLLRHGKNNKRWIICARCTNVQFRYHLRMLKLFGRITKLLRTL